MRVPAEAYYGVQTQRAVENFPISGLTRARRARHRHRPDQEGAPRWPTRRSGGSTASVADAIVAAADEILAGALRDQFVVDVYQAGAGTSHNMNANEVLANRAAEILGEPRGDLHAGPPQRSRQHGPVDQRRVPDRDAAGAAAGAAATRGRRAAAWPTALDAKAREFAHVLKTGRTHLQDAVPITLGQEFGGYAANVRHAAEPRRRARVPTQLHELNLGATAVGTGLNAGDDYTRSDRREPRAR